MGLLRSGIAFGAMIIILGCTKGGEVKFDNSNLLADAEVTDVYPHFISPSGGETITLEGSSLPEGANVLVGGKVCTDLHLASAGKWQCLAPALGTGIKASVEIAFGSNRYSVPKIKLRTAIVLGAPNLTSNLSLEYGLSVPRSVLMHSGKLWVGDYGNERINHYSAFPTTSYSSPSFTLGQPDLGTKINGNNYRNRYGSVAAWQIATDGQHFAAADTGSNRVLIWNSMPSSMYAPADVVIGQLGMSDDSANFEGVTARTLNTPDGVAIASGKLIVADRANNRVLIWNTIPTENGQAADVVLGQPDMTTATSNNGGRSASSLSQPYNVTVTGTKLLVADRVNSRVLIWNTIPTANKTAADLELGQPNFTSGTANQGGIGAATLQLPYGIWTDGTKLAVTDTTNNRVLLWDTFPTVNRPAASRVIGQSDFTSNAAGTSNARLNAPESVASDGTKLVVADTQNNRVLIWNSWPSTDGVAADLVLGQPNFTDSLARNSNDPQHFNNPMSVVKVAGKMVLADALRQRILIWNSEPTLSATAADVVLGQTDFNGYKANQGGSASASTLSTVRSIWTTGTKLFAADGSNNRVMIWNTIPTVNAQPADIVLGQPDMTTVTANTGGVSASSLSLPGCVTSDGVRLVVCDFTNNRVLIWNTIPTSSNTPADLVLGQPNFTSNTANNGGRSASTMQQPYGAAIIGTKLLISDYGNFRVLIWNSLPTSNGQAADVVIGQANFSDGGQNSGLNQSLAANGFAAPKGIATDSTGALYISDITNDRILKFNSVPTANGASADEAIGQNSLTKLKAIGPAGIQQIYDFLIDGQKIYIPDYINSRLLIAPL